MKSLLRFLILSLFFILCYGQKLSYDNHENEMTMIIQPKGLECLYQQAKEGSAIEIEYQVIDAGFGDMDVHHDLNINFHLYSPTGDILITDFKQSDATHRWDVKIDGDYKFCFDNIYSFFTKKSVYFEVYVDAGDDDDKWQGFDFPPELIYNDTIDSIKISIAKVHQDLNSIKHYQDTLRAIESRDRNLQEHNFTRVNHFSMLFIVSMLLVGAVQVIMIRSLFEEHSRLHKIFKVLS